MCQLKLLNSFLMWVRAAVFTCLYLITPRLLPKCLLQKLNIMSRNRKVKPRADDSGEHGFLPAWGDLALSELDLQLGSQDSGSQAGAFIHSV